jgi:arylsulfatase
MPEQQSTPTADDVRPREVLPIPDRPASGVTTYLATDPGAHFPPITCLRPPAGAPNVLVILLDDVGFGASSVFGGPVNMPTAERLAGNGLRYSGLTPPQCAHQRGRRC